MLLSRLPWSLIGLLTSLVTPASGASAERYSESLRLTPFADGKVHSSFQFSMEGPWYEEGEQLGMNAIAQHHSLLPSTLTSILRHYRVGSFHLTLSSGRWSPHWSTASTPASGIELVAWLERSGEEAEERKRWEGFTGALGGLFCTGVTGVKGEASSPLWGYRFDGEGLAEEHRLFRIILPRLSATCTESLTPFLSLLPCSGRAGLGSLLNPHRLFDGEWTLLGVHFTRQERLGRVKLEVGSVADPVRVDRLAGGLGSRDFSLESLHSRTLVRACPVASTSTVSLTIPRHSTTAFEVEPSEGYAKSTRRNGQDDVVAWNVRRVPQGESFNAAVKWPSENPFRYPAPSKLPLPPLSARRLLLGRGQERGHLGVELINNEDREVHVIWVEEWPWWVRGFVSTLDVRSTALESAKALDFEASIANLSYSPPIARQRPTTLQALVSLPPRSRTRVLLNYESGYLWYTEYPSDAHRGFELPGALVILLDSASDLTASVGKERLRINTATSLLSLPTPDFSMPYNVIILTSTVVALFWGSVVNKVRRGWWVVDLRE